MKSRLGCGVLAATLALAPTTPAGAAAQASGDRASFASALEREYPDLHALLVRLERVQGMLYAELLEEGEAVRAGGAHVPTEGFEVRTVERLTTLVGAEGTLEELRAEAEAGYALLGPRGAEVIARAQAFHRELLGIYADESVTDRRAAVDAAVQRYLSRPDVALPAEPKDMDVLYDHAFAWALRTGYPDVGGWVWAAQWLRLAATEPLTDFPGRAERAAGLDTVANRFYLKLSYAEPPEFFPSELPLTPPIAPGLVFWNPTASIILDNLSMMQDVLADILVSPHVPNVRVALEEAIDQFVDPDYRITTEDDWVLMALRHGIFNQGGPALSEMRSNERNSSGHLQHLKAGGPMIMPGME